MRYSTENLILSPNDAIDLQLHTVYSDGDWTPNALIDYLLAEQFSLAAVTDHDRVDTLVSLQELAIEKRFPLLVACEITGQWKGQLTDFLCYGFDPEDNALQALAADLLYRQRENMRLAFRYFQRAGYPATEEHLRAILERPSAQQVHDFVGLVSRFEPDETARKKIYNDAGLEFATHEPSVIVEAAHQSGAICVLAHPGRSDGFVCYDEPLLNELREEAKIDGIEAHYPLHSPEQTRMFLAYAKRYGLLVSSGSDSHRLEKPPIKYPAELSRELLERVGIQMK
jgi:predicted metal-dependent phosphoesterase TrpH